MTLYEKLIAAGLPIASATESGEISGLPGVQMTPVQQQLFSDIVMEYFHPVEYAVQVEKKSTQANAVSGYSALPDWIRTMTAPDAETYINAQIWNGISITDANAWIDSTVKDLATARTALKQIAGAVISMRGLFILTAKLLIYIRDLVIRYIN